MMHNPTTRSVRVTEIKVNEVHVEIDLLDLVDSYEFNQADAVVIRIRYFDEAINHGSTKSLRFVK